MFCLLMWSFPFLFYARKAYFNAKTWQRYKKSIKQEKFRVNF